MSNPAIRLCVHCGELLPPSAACASLPDGQHATSWCSRCHQVAGGPPRRLRIPTDPSRLLTIWWRLGFSTLLAGQGMLLSLAVNLSDTGTRDRLVLHLLLASTSLAVILLLGWPLLKAATLAIADRRITVELLFLTGMIGAIAASIQSVITGQGPVYFEVTSILLVVYTFSKTMLAKRRASSLAATQGWLRNLQKARLRDQAGRTSFVPATAINRDDLVEVQPGEWVPIDGVVQQGTAFVRDTPMTGEPFARVVRAGDSVLAGFAVEDATLLIRATTAGSERVIDEVRLMVEEARGTIGALQRHADRLTSVFLPVVLAISVGTFAVWTAVSGWESALMNSMSVLLVACPCALGLATPLAVWSTLSLLASQGLVVRQANAIDALAAVDHVVFDKTGTLTDDSLHLVDIATRATGSERARLLSWLAFVESRSNHPVARGLVGISAGSEIDAISNLELEIHPGCGIRAKFNDKHGAPHQMRIGRPGWIEGTSTGRAVELVNRTFLESALRCTEGARIDVELDGRLEAICILREKVRENVPRLIAELRRNGIRVSVLTGDTSERSRAAGFDNVIGNVSPEEKVRFVQDWQTSGSSCLYVGDGINDAPAMCTAHAAVAMLSGTERKIPPVCLHMRSHA